MPIVSVETSSTQLLSAGVRKKIIASNLGANRVWIIASSTATLNEGFPLDAGEKIVLDSSKTEINPNWNAIAVTSATNVSVYELN